MRWFRKSPPPAEPDFAGRLPVWYAAMDGDTASVRRWLDGGGDVDHADKEGATLLFIAAHYGQADTVRLLLDHGAEVDRAERKFANAPLWEATREACAGPLHKDGHAAVVQLLLGAGADPNRPNKVGKIPPGWAAGEDEHRLAVQAIYRAHGYAGNFSL